MIRAGLALLVAWGLLSLVTACAYTAARWYIRHTPPPPPSSVVLAPCPHCGHPEAMADCYRRVCLHCMTVVESQEVAG